jgi:predicted lipid-binding transport protein (Tim44 family)
MIVCKLYRRNPDGSPDTAYPVVTVPYGREAVAKIDALTGRTIGSYILAEAGRKGRRGQRERAYVVANRDSEAVRVWDRNGFMVEVVRSPRVPA